MTMKHYEVQCTLCWLVSWTVYVLNWDMIWCKVPFHWALTLLPHWFCESVFVSPVRPNHRFSYIDNIPDILFILVPKKTTNAGSSHRLNTSPMWAPTIILQLNVIQCCSCHMSAMVTLPLYLSHYIHNLYPFLQGRRGRWIMMSYFLAPRI